jgi:hypothetical protein
MALPVLPARPGKSSCNQSRETIMPAKRKSTKKAPVNTLAASKKGGVELEEDELKRVTGGTVQLAVHDMELVQFQEGNTSQPIVVGSVYNGKS